MEEPFFMERQLRQGFRKVQFPRTLLELTFHEKRLFHHAAVIKHAA
jgi:hypothetical protein